jgi:riboflavin kinase/FMN adenylyltransferase
MKVIIDRFENIKVHDKLCVALGTFDGVHYGHQKLIKYASDKATALGIKSAVLTFDVHPFNALNPEKKIKLISDNNTKQIIIDSLKIDYLFFVEFEPSFAQMNPVNFIEMLKKNLNSEIIVCGYNFTFGRRGEGNPLMLEKYKSIYDYKLKVMDKIMLNNENISSSIIRKNMELGQIKKANTLLNYNYFLSGKVIEGKRLGSKLGFPTANIIISEDLCIKNGVYITKAYVNEKIYHSISNVGYLPTFNGNLRKVESNLFDFNGDLYGLDIKVEFIDFIREERRFSSVEELKETVIGDINTARNYFSMNGIYSK